MSNFKKISASEFETSRFYQLPKFLFEDKYFSKMSTDAKVMYALLKDRFELSRLNNWVDSENNIYLLYTNKKLCSILNYAEPKIIKLKKELEKYNLIINERQGLNKPNKIYLLEPTYDKELINSKFQNKEFISSRTDKSLVQELTNSKSNDTEFNNTDYIETKDNDMNDMSDNNIKSNGNLIHSYHPNHDLQNFDEEALKFTELQEFPKYSKQYLNNFSYRDLKIVKEIILKAKKSFNSEHNTTYMLEDIDHDLVNVLKRFKSKVYMKNESIEKMQGYLMKCIKMELEELHSVNMRKKNFKNSPWNIFSQNY
ncbi:replication initiator protein A [Staphylococcus aureus]|uniref:replication initiator protein A n=1 Tax=Staphylococcus aureus TaxID=1280 RepID=UPI0004500C54|nr:replication initiator protein A [Staphylococcus aureus]EZY69325.1 hypothetical protein V063_02482 [Staphylococcus aureus R0487]EZY76244.1 hypothetical protein V066_02674 [Staphylococcus aureus R0615]MCR0868875.1 replication initiator protein A [Staphylococcus aureus]HCX3193477.1 replication initiator protein A [Staphylococcus aureus]HDP5873903.1 replication initiator protein A [Staphylococcus aureus]